MRYKVLYLKLKKRSRNVSQSQPPDWKAQVKKPDSKVQKPQNMILAESPDKAFVERKNAINKMVNMETRKDRREKEQKKTFHYPAPRLRASFTLKVAPDSTTADLPEPTPPNVLANSSNQILVDNNYDAYLPPRRAYFPHYGPYLEDPIYPYPEFDRQLPAFSPRRILTQVPVINDVPTVLVPVLANRSSHYIPNDDKDFEIPLEESLKAVEDFIKREKELAKWRVGEDVLAQWKGNGLFYKAKILEIRATGVVVILFDTYDITEAVDYTDLRKFFQKTSNLKKKGRAREKPKADTEKKDKQSAKKQIKVKKNRKKLCKRLHFVSILKRSDRLRKKRLYASRKKSHILRLKKKGPDSPTNIVS